MGEIDRHKVPNKDKYNTEKSKVFLQSLLLEIRGQ